MANTDIPISVTAGELEEAVQKVPQHETAIANNTADIRKIEMIPRNIECKIDWNYQDSVTVVVVECDIGESHETFNTIVSMTTGKPDLFGDLSGAKSVDLCLKLVEDSQSGKTSWGLSEGYNDGNPFVKYEIRVGTYWYIVDTSPVVITGFCSFDNKNLFENYNADMTNKADTSYVDEQDLALNQRIDNLQGNKADTSYVNTKDTEVLSTAKQYTDEQDLALGQRIDNLQTNKAEQSQVDSIVEGLGSVQESKADKTYVEEKFNGLSDTYLTKTTANSTYLKKTDANSTYLSKDMYPVIKGVKSGQNYVIDDISPVNDTLKLTMHSGSWCYIMGKNLLLSNIESGIVISGEDWSSDFMWCLLPQNYSYKLVINGEPWIDGLTAKIEFFDNDYGLLGSAYTSDGNINIGDYGSWFDATNHASKGTAYIKINFIYPSSSFTLNSLMITLQSLSDDYEEYNSNISGFYPYSEVTYDISDAYPTALILGEADSYTTTEYYRDIDSIVEGLTNKVDKSDIDKQLSKTSSNPIANKGVMEGLTPIIEALKLDGIYIIGVTLSSIGTNAFKNNTDIKKASIANSVTIINTRAFYGCSSLTNIILPSNLKSIGQSAFTSCTSLTNITIPSTVTTINNSAFSTCTSLTSVTIPKNVTSIGSGVFFKCTSLTSINVDSSNNNYCSIDGVLFNKSKTIIMQYPLGSTNTSYTIPDTVTTINSNVFSYCSSLTNLVIPEGVISIGQSAFSNCTSLESVTIPSTVTTINSYAFNECTSLTSVVIPDKVTTINSNTFYKCTSLASVTIGSGVTTIKEDAFMYCSSLTNLVIPEGVISIGSFAFADCRGLTSVTLPSSITSIIYNTFGNCTALTEVILGSDFNATLNVSSGSFTADVMVAMFNNLKDLTGATAKTLTLGSTNLAKLTAEQKAIATNKNWNLA